MFGDGAGHGRCVRVRQAVLGEHVGHLCLGLPGAFGDLLALTGDLGFEDLPLALAAHVFPGSHAEDPGQAGGDPGNEHREAVRRGAGNGAHHRQRADQPVLGAEDRLTDLPEQARLAALLAQVRPQPLRVEFGGRRSCRRRFEDVHAWIVAEGRRERAGPAERLTATTARRN